MVGTGTVNAQTSERVDGRRWQVRLWELVGARPGEGKNGADGGIDRRICFHAGDGTTRQIRLDFSADDEGEPL
jgi:hypothetical protein